MDPLFDADERLTPALVDEIEATLAQRDSPYDGYMLRKRTIFMGRWIRHGGQYPAWHRPRAPARVTTAVGFASQRERPEPPATPWLVICCGRPVNGPPVEKRDRTPAARIVGQPCALGGGSRAGPR
jgi:hypothetical protein